MGHNPSFLIGPLLTLFFQIGGAEYSCNGRCNLLMLRAPCHCTPSCQDFGSCCQELCIDSSDQLTSQLEVPKMPSLEMQVRSPVLAQAPQSRAPANGRPAAKPAGSIVKIGNIFITATTTCQGFGPATVGIEMPDGSERSMVLYLPEGAEKAPLWLAMHGTNQHAETFLSWTGLDSFAKGKGIALVALQGVRHAAYNGLIRFNVGVASEPISTEAPDDVALVRRVLDSVLQLPCIDSSSVHCTGYSNGGRFCSRLGSELSDYIASIAPVSGLRFPFRNNATRPVPVLAFHGTADPINPWEGHGHGYWNIPVPDALQKWAQLNGCYWANHAPMFVGIPGKQMSLAVYDECKERATVKLVKLLDAGHQWPGCNSPIPGLGKASSLNGNELMHTFFQSKTLDKNVPQSEYPI